MESLTVILVIILLIGIPIFLSINNLERENEKIRPEQVINLLESAYRNYTTEQIVSEIDKLTNKRTIIRMEQDFFLYAKHKALSKVLEKRKKYGDEIHLNNFKISSKIQYEDENRKMCKIQYTATIDFDFENNGFGFGNAGFVFIYNHKLTNKIPTISEYFSIPYYLIKSVEAKNNCLIFKLENNDFFKSFIPTNINCDFEEGEYLSFELETETPLEIKKIIDRIMKIMHEDDN